VGTPFYCYSSATLERHYKVMDEAFAGTDHLICYAMKANSNQAVIRTMAEMGAGMDVVSEGELRRALAAGVPARKIVFSGVGKTAREMALALREGHCLLQCRVGTGTGTALGRSPTAWGSGPACRSASIRMWTPRPTPRSPPARPTTSSAFPTSARPRSMPGRRALPAIDVAGIDMHIGSQITELAPFEKAFTLMADLTEQLLAEGHMPSAISIWAAASACPTAAQTFLRTRTNMPRCASACWAISASSWCWSPAA
jgi:diaminopimelate decarboxylase